MKVAVLSGKGGTGKTLVAVNLAAAAEKCTYIDADVEAPNGYLFFKPTETQSRNVTVKIPYVDDLKCTGCRKCVEFCKFNALAYIHNRLMVFEDICHSCGGCLLVCPENALNEKEKPIGEIVTGNSQSVSLKLGKMNLGESTGVPIIKALLEDIQDPVVIDGPPGSACTVMETIKNVDYCVLVAEPTEFGKHNLAMVHELLKGYGKPFGVVLNKTTDQDNPSKEYCTEENIPILMEIPYDEKLGRLNSEGLIAVREDVHYKTLFEQLYQKIEIGGRS
ncbi:nucleotide-binding protein [Fusibacter tunisiensis]|uniref:MinD superfamily P-loop ATPase n=1 Tax=Fusibacter tunisiensis TaxID=1008308 RepID=A0ABS2MRS4_9FIRM|nr:ATP-binding protein [Fusibacter tunisiensis]MBM7562119.1 MinD superfamily P-loop ATPase [Fusibacter tunisiensis]